MEQQGATLSFGGGPNSCSTRSLAYSFGTAPTVANAAAPSQLKAHAYSSGAAPKLQSAAFFHIVIVFQCPVTGAVLEVLKTSPTNGITSAAVRLPRWEASALVTVVFSHPMTVTKAYHAAIATATATAATFKVSRLLRSSPSSAPPPWHSPSA